MIFSRWCQSSPSRNPNSTLKKTTTEKSKTKCHKNPTPINPATHLLLPPPQLQGPSSQVLLFESKSLPGAEKLADPKFLNDVLPLQKLLVQRLHLLRGWRGLELRLEHNDT